MNDYNQARSSEGKGKSATTETFWAELWWPMEKNSHGEAKISPTFERQGECTAWIRANKVRKGLEAQIGTWKRVSREGSYEDIPLDTDEAPLPNPERLHKLVEELKAMLEQKKRELDRGPAKGVPIKRPDTTMDPIKVHQYAYDEVWDENGNKRFEWDANGWPIE